MGWAARKKQKQIASGSVVLPPKRTPSRLAIDPWAMMAFLMAARLRKRAKEADNGK